VRVVRRGGGSALDFFALSMLLATALLKATTRSR
jgi:hypothetical protein